MRPEIVRPAGDITVEASNAFKVKIPFTGNGNIEAKCSQNGAPIHGNKTLT